MAKYRKKPVVIDAIQYNGNNFDEIFHFINSVHCCEIPINNDEYIIIETLEGDMKATPGDWIIKGVNREFYPCKNDIFEKLMKRLNNE